VWRAYRPSAEISDGACRRFTALTLAGCCARAASGHAAAPPSSVMNARLLARNSIQCFMQQA